MPLYEKSTFCFGVAGNCVVVATKRAPSKEDFDSLISAVEAQTSDFLGLLVRDDSGQGITANQRKRIAEVVANKEAKGAVLTDSIMVRSVVKAVRLFGANFAAYKTSEVEAAVEFLGVGPGEIQAVLTVLHEAYERAP